MRLALLVLGLAFGAVQSVTLVDCCCGSLCPHQDRRCTGCGDDAECTLGSAPSPEKPSCCATEAPPAHSSEEEGCSHFNPSGETALQSSAPDLPSPDAEALVISPPDDIPARPVEPDALRARDRPREKPDRPVYLRLHAFLI